MANPVKQLFVGDNPDYEINRWDELQRKQKIYMRHHFVVVEPSPRKH